jgi:hypothetical protein
MLALHHFIHVVTTSNLFYELVAEQDLERDLGQVQFEQAQGLEATDPV